MVGVIQRSLAHANARRQNMTKPGETPVQSRCIVWAHSSHLGDATSTEHGSAPSYGGGDPEVNVGSLCRQIYGKENVFIIGQMTNSGVCEFPVNTFILCIFIFIYLLYI